MQKMQEELKQMDDSMETILRDNVLPIDKWRLLFHIRTYLNHFHYLFDSVNNENNNSSVQLKRKTIGSSVSNNHKRRKYCDEQPNQLSMLK